MTRDEEDAVVSRSCPDDEELAMYVDGRVDEQTRRQLDAHLAECSQCRAVLAETAAYVDAQGRRASTPAAWQRTWPRVMLAAALAATLILVARATFNALRRPSASARPELAELVAAAAHEPARLAEGRLTGGFSYKPAPVATRGAADARVSPEVKIAAAKLEQASGHRNDPAAEAALGTSSLAVGDLDQAVDRLEAAVEQRPDDPRFQNDLSVAYIARATRAGRLDDWPKALAAAERAARRDATLVEACFNRALALEGLRLAAEAADAWAACAQVDAGSGWADEARVRASAIRERLRTGKDKPQSRQPQREAIEDRLLVQWAEAEAAGDTSRAAPILDNAERLARDLASAGGDAMPRDEIDLIRASAVGAPRRAALVRAHLAFGRARQAFLAERLQDASAEMAVAAGSFARAGSPYQYWAPIYRAIPSWIDGDADRALRQLASVPLDRLPDAYFHLRGRVAWTRAMAFETEGRFDVARVALEEARELFRRAGELEYASVNASYLAEADWFLGNREHLWRNQLDAVEHVDALPPNIRRNAILESAAVLALGDGLPETALAFQQHLFRLSQAQSPAPHVAEPPNAYLRRAQIRDRLGDVTGAFADLAMARAAANETPERRLREWILAEVDTARSELLARTDPAAAIAAADAALTFYQRSSAVVRVSELLMWRARAHEARGAVDSAARDYEAAIVALERDQDSISAPRQRKAAFDQQRTAVREAVRFAADVQRDPAAALSIAERARARALRQKLAGVSARALDPDAARASLPNDVAVLYYVTLADRILVWVLTNRHSAQFAVPIDAARLDATVRRLHRRIAANASLGDVSGELQELRPFVEPALSQIDSGTTIVIVPDQGLARIPFAALPDRDGAPLVTRHPLVVAPSLTTFLLASQRLAGFEPDGVLAIGDGHDPVATGVPRLRFADAEAAAVAGLYPRASLFTDSKATARNFLGGRQPVIHFAGHTLANAEFPFLSRLLFAPEPIGDSRSGALLAEAVAEHKFVTTRLVVLATCESAAGHFIRDEGFDSVARMFLDAGVPSVVASMWPLDDDQSPFLIEFHRQLRASRDVARALRAAQLKALREAGGRAPIRRWAGFVAVGGTSAPRFRKGVDYE